MSEHRSDFAPALASSSPRSRRWVIAAVSAISLSGLLFGGLLAPVSAGDVAGDVGSGVSAEFDGTCVKVAVNGDGAGGSVSPQGDGDSSGLEVTADGTGTSEVSICRDDLGEGLPEDPGGDVPGDPGGSVPGELDDVAGEVTAAVLGELDGAVTDDPGNSMPGDLGDGVPGDLGDGVPGPGNAVPGDLGDGVPGDFGGLLTDGLGLVPELLDRISSVVPPGGVDNGGHGGNDGNGPSPSASGTGTASVVAGADEGGTPGDHVLDGQLGDGAPGSNGGALLPTGGTLPRTGGGLGSGLLRMFAVLGIGRAALRLAGRRRASMTGMIKAS